MWRWILFQPTLGVINFPFCDKQSSWGSGHHQCSKERGVLAPNYSQWASRAWVHPLPPLREWEWVGGLWLGGWWVISSP